MNMLKKIGDGITWVNTKINDAASWLMYPLILVIMYEIVRRYFLNSPTNWVYDMTWILYGCFVFLGGAYTLHVGGHVKADIIYNMMPPKGKAVFDIIGYAVFYFPVMTLMVYSCFTYFLKSWQLQDVSNMTIWAPVLWPCKLIILISMVMLLLQGIVECVRDLAPLFRGRGNK